MRDIITKKWFIATLATWIAIFALDELTYQWWMYLHPGSAYGGTLIKHPLVAPPTEPGTTTANGYRPGGSINAAG